MEISLENLYVDIRLKGLSINSTVEAKRRPTFMGQDSLFQAPRWWGRGESKRHAKRGAGQFPLVLFSCLGFLNSAGPTISEPGTG